MRVVVVWSGNSSPSDAGFELLVEHLTEHERAADTSYLIVRNWSELFVRDFSGYDAVLVHGASSGVWLPFFKIRCGTKVILHLSSVYGQERCNVLDTIGRRIEKRAVESADVLAADNKSIGEYLSDTYGRTAEVIAYGGNHFRMPDASAAEEDFLSGCHFKSGSYALAICRIIPENNCETILEAFSRSLEPLLFAGDWENGDYAAKLKRRFGALPNISLMNRDSVTDVAYPAMKNCRIFVCGHGGFGTDPMLVGAMTLGKPVICYDTPSNRYATRGMAHYFKSSQDILRLIFIDDFNGMPMYAIAKGIYDWKYINRKYQSLYER